MPSFTICNVRICDEPTKASIFVSDENLKKPENKALRDFISDKTDFYPNQFIQNANGKVEYGIQIAVCEKHFKELENLSSENIIKIADYSIENIRN